MNSHGTNILHWYKSDKFKCSFTRTVNSTFSVPFGNVFHAVLWCCLRNVKKIKVTAHRTVTLTIRVNEPKNLQKALQGIQIQFNLSFAVASSHWFTVTSSVTTSSRLQRAAFFASKYSNADELGYWLGSTVQIPNFQCLHSKK